MNTLDNVLLDNVLLGLVPPGLAAPAFVLYRQPRAGSDEPGTCTVPLVLAVVALVQGGLIDRGRPALAAALPAVRLLAQSLVRGRRARRLAGFAPVNVAS